MNKPGLHLFSTSLLVSWSRLIRWENIIITATTQWLFYQCLLRDTFADLHETALFHDLFMGQLIAISAMVLAGGNIYNDICDVRSDAYNKPNRLIIGRGISANSALRVWQWLNLLAIALSFHLAYQSRAWMLPALVLLSISLLYLYSQKWQYRPWLGTISIATLCSLTILIIASGAWADLTFLKQTYPGVFLRTISYFLTFTLFAFLANFIREIAKDMEDVVGDRLVGSNNLATTWDTAHLKALVILPFALVLGLLLLMYLNLDDYLSRNGFYYLLGLLFSTIAILLGFMKANSTTQWKRITLWLKLYMLQGVLFIIFWQTS
ncbi:MAG: UbiA family prenyltransferase [Saprospiraceae bacterium]|nr:UbiA family prenyltransferase [Saprospiraceae bacterium]